LNGLTSSGQGRALSPWRGDFDAMLRQQYSTRLEPKAEGRLWQIATPEDWRKPNQGRLRDSKVVRDWRLYAKPISSKKGSSSPGGNPL